ncbi:unnamed protein product [Moneuplotes crassus]|uniref:Uncharacterized protein n=1 Tax=Euplotes crassus TaxID=5936 RepID=A0AAD1X1Z4_EUPCR|nr:unnamed protein product [Moneuplotes crassus]
MPTASSSDSTNSLKECKDEKYCACASSPISQRVLFLGMVCVRIYS